MQKVILMVFILIATDFVHATREDLTSLCEDAYVFCGAASTTTKISSSPLPENENSNANYRRVRPTPADVSEKRVCEYEERTFFEPPKAVKTESGEWKYLASDQSVFNQPISIERCLYEDKPCSALNGLLTADAKTKCIQKYITVYLDTVNPDTQNISKERVNIPVACVCSISSYYFPGDN